MGECSIAPSGHYALFESKGKMLLFDARSGLSRDVTDGHLETPKSISWRECDGKVEVLYYKTPRLSEILLKP